MRGKIIRIDKSKEGVFGVLTLNTQAVCLTLERPWLDNKPDISCIPADIYICKRHPSPEHGETFKILNVPGRTDILFHIGNRIINSKGCVLPGSEYGMLDGDRAVLESGKAFKKFMEIMDGVDAFPLQIINL